MMDMIFPIQCEAVDLPTSSQWNLCKLQPAGESRLLVELHGFACRPGNCGTDVEEAVKSRT